MDHYADDLEVLTEHLDLKNAIYIGHSTGGGEVTRYLGRQGEGRVSQAALISTVPPLMVKTAVNPLGLPKAVFDDLQAQLEANRFEILYGFGVPSFLQTTTVRAYSRVRPPSTIGGGRA